MSPKDSNRKLRKEERLAKSVVFTIASTAALGFITQLIQILLATLLPGPETPAPQVNPKVEINKNECGQIEGNENNGSGDINANIDCAPRYEDNRRYENNYMYQDNRIYEDNRVYQDNRIDLDNRSYESNQTYINHQTWQNAQINQNVQNQRSYRHQSYLGVGVGIDIHLTRPLISPNGDTDKRNNQEGKDSECNSGTDHPITVVPGGSNYFACTPEGKDW